MEPEYFKQDLQHAVDSAVGFVRFAETKNAALLTINLAVSLGLAQNDKQGISAAVFRMGGDGFCFILLGVSALLCLVSFFPRLSNIWSRERRQRPEDNLLYFGDAAKYNRDDFLKAFVQRYSVPTDPATTLDISDISDLSLDYAGQIVNNSVIAWNKYQIFSFALGLTLMGLVDIFLGLIFA